MSRSIIQYEWAEDAEGKLHHAAELAKRTDFDRDTLFCAGCLRQVTAKVHGEIKQPHFAHRSGEPCPFNFYLERTVKKLFAKSFSERRDRGEPFTLEVRRPLLCHRYIELFDSPCVIDKDHVLPVDLTRFYDGFDFLPNPEGLPDDLRLNPRSGHDGLRPLFIEVEIYDSHSTSRKITRDDPTLVLHIVTDDDLNALECAHLRPHRFEAINFIVEPMRATEAQCQCVGKLFNAIVKYDSGKVYCDTGTIGELQKKYGCLHRVDFYALSPASNPTDIRGAMYTGIFQLLREGVAVRNCLMCRHQKRPFGRAGAATVFCRMYDKRANWNDAITCQGYSLSPDIELSLRHRK
jgi:hypothetical protein